MTKPVTEQHVTARFSAAATTYHNQPGVQKQVAEKVADLCTKHVKKPLEAPYQICEIGCGTGYLTKLLADRFGQAAILATDISPNMINTARTRLSDNPLISWEAGDLNTLPIPSNCNLITSSSALHWMQPLPKTIQVLQHHLAANGVFVCGMMTKGTFAELRTLRAEVAPDKPSKFELPDLPQVLSVLKREGFQLDHIEHQELLCSYSSAMAFIRTLNRQGVTGGFFDSKTTLTRAELKQLIHGYDHRFKQPDGTVPATYKVLYFICSPQRIDS